MARSAFKMKSGNSPLFKNMGSSPIKEEKKGTKTETKTTTTTVKPKGDFSVMSYGDYNEDKTKRWDGFNFVTLKNFKDK